MNQTNVELIRNLTKSWRETWKIAFPLSGSWKKNDLAVGFAPKFCAECNGRELLGSHGDHFRELLRFCTFSHNFCRFWNLPTPASGAGPGSSATYPTKDELKIRNAPMGWIKKKKMSNLWRWSRLQRHMLPIFFLIHVPGTQAIRLIGPGGWPPPAN